MWVIDFLTICTRGQSVSKEDRYHRLLAIWAKRGKSGVARNAHYNETVTCGRGAKGIRDNGQSLDVYRGEHRTPLSRASAQRLSVTPLSVDHTALPGGAVVRRTMSSVGNSMRWSGGSGWLRAARSNLAPRRPSSRIGTCTVVSPRYWVSSMSL
jgi:hypothetical protein